MLSTDVPLSAPGAEERLRLNLRTATRLYRIDQQDLAASVGVSQPTMSKLMSGHMRFRVEHLDGLAKAFHVTIAQLLADYPEGQAFERRSGRDRRSGIERRTRTLHPEHFSGGGGMRMMSA